MTFATVMVPLDLGSCSLDRLKLAGSLADRFDARLIGVAARARPAGPVLWQGLLRHQRCRRRSRTGAWRTNWRMSKRHSRRSPPSGTGRSADRREPIRWRT